MPARLRPRRAMGGDRGDRPWQRPVLGFHLEEGGAAVLAVDVQGGDQWLTTDDRDPRPWAHPLPAWPVHALPLERPRPERPVVVPLHRAPDGGVLAGLGRIVLEAPVGERNNRLNWAAYRAGEHVRGGRISQVAAVTALQLAAERIGLTVAETRGTIASGLASGAA